MSSSLLLFPLCLFVDVPVVVVDAVFVVGAVVVVFAFFSIPGSVLDHCVAKFEAFCLRQIAKK